MKISDMTKAVLFIIGYVIFYFMILWLQPFNIALIQGLAFGFIIFAAPVTLIAIFALFICSKDYIKERVDKIKEYKNTYVGYKQVKNKAGMLSIIPKGGELSEVTE